MDTPLSTDEKRFLLALARQSITAAVTGQEVEGDKKQAVPNTLMQKGASFVTLTIQGELRGCIGTLEAYQPLYSDVEERAVQAALEDYRFPPVTSEELDLISIEISHLTPSIPLPYKNPLDLPGLLHPNVDGVILRDGMRRATFLPQVWSQLPEASGFLAHLCQKMGAAPDLWRHKVLDVSIYHVEEFSEENI
jgi:AmmeMemoRadiSam system protein A